MPRKLIIDIAKNHRNGNGKMAQHFYPVIERICQQECDRLMEINTEQTISRANDIRDALNRLKIAIGLREKIVQPNVRHISQVEGEEDLVRLLAFDFSNINTLLEFKSVTISWSDEKVCVYRDDEFSSQGGMDFSVQDGYDFVYKYHTFPSLQDALQEIRLERPRFYSRYTMSSKNSICEKIEKEIDLLIPTIPVQPELDQEAGFRNMSNWRSCSL